MIVCSSASERASEQVEKNVERNFITYNSFKYLLVVEVFAEHDREQTDLESSPKHIYVSTWLIKGILSDLDFHPMYEPASRLS